MTRSMGEEAASSTGSRHNCPLGHTAASSPPEMLPVPPVTNVLHAGVAAAACVSMSVMPARPLVNHVFSGCALFTHRLGSNSVETASNA